MKLFALCLMIFALACAGAPPAFARSEEPMFGVAWTPTACENPYGIMYCVNLYIFVNNLSNEVIDAAWGNVWYDPLALSGCLTHECFVQYYNQRMEYWRHETCRYGENINDNELDHWCFDLFDRTEEFAIAAN